MEFSVIFDNGWLGVDRNKLTVHLEDSDKDFSLTWEELYNLLKERK